MIRKSLLRLVSQTLISKSSSIYRKIPKLLPLGVLGSIFFIKGSQLTIVPRALCQQQEESIQMQELKAVCQEMMQGEKWIELDELQKRVFSKGEKLMIVMLDVKEVQTDVDLLNSVISMGQKMKQSLGVEVFFLNTSGQQRQKVLQVLQKKKLKVKLEQELKKVNFLLVNGFQDWWFHSEDFIHYGYQQLRMIFNYYLGIPQLKNTDMLMAESTDNSSHFLIYQSDSENNAKLKPFRRLHAFDGDPFLRKRFWKVVDKKMADQLGLTCKLQTDIEQGAIYMYRPVSIFSPRNKESVQIDGFYFNVSRIASDQQVQNLETNLLYAKLATPVFQAPIFIETQRDWSSYLERVRVLHSQYARVPIVLAYCDPISHQELFKKIVGEMREARKEAAPLDLTVTPEEHKQKEDPDINFVITSVVPDFFQTNFKEGQPQILFINPKNMFSLLDKPVIRNGLTPQEVKQKSKEVPERWAQLSKAVDIQEKERNRIESQISQFQAQNFTFMQMHRLWDLQALDMKSFIKKSLDGSLKQYWPSLRLKYYGFPLKNSFYTTGSDFQKRVLKSPQTWVVLFFSSDYEGNFYHCFDAISRKLSSDVLKFAHCNINNTCAYFKFPAKPCILVFKAGDKQNPILYDLGYFARYDPLNLQIERFQNYLKTHNLRF